MHLYLKVSHRFACECTFTSPLHKSLAPLILTAQVVPQCGSAEACIAGVVAVGLVTRSLVDDDKVAWFDCHKTDEDRQQGYGDHQQNDEGSAGIDVGPHKTHKQTEQKDY